MIFPCSQAKNNDTKVLKDLFILVKFIEVYCHDLHADVSELQDFELKTHNLKELTRKQPRLCPGCRKLLAHALTMRTTCPMNPKPTCKHCPKHCYHPRYRQQIRDVMKYSGRKLVLRGRIDYLIHLLF